MEHKYSLCHSDVTLFGFSKNSYQDASFQNISADQKQNCEANQVRILYVDVFKCVRLQN